ncbi:MAG: radical SAM protein [Treponema sp.]|jgi:hypothetical protein|nr:radical SAM protein [Treponema sp.]
MKPGVPAGAADICLVQPPFVQLNGPYPSLHYLAPFLKKLGHRVIVQDHSIGLFEEIFCRRGLEKIFRDAAAREQFHRSGGIHERFWHERFLSEQGTWLTCVDRLVAFLRGRDYEAGHFFALANGCLPGGPRTGAFTAQNKGELSPEQAKILASRLLADLADFITFSLDSSFSLVRYGSPPGVHSFDEIRLDGYIIKEFYLPYLENQWKDLAGKIGGGDDSGGRNFIIGATVPFSGCLAGALACARSAKRYFGADVATVCGGGYISTELRFLEDERIFDYFDYLSFDDGYTSLEGILGRTGMSESGEAIPKTMFRLKTGGIVRADDLRASRTDAVLHPAATGVFPDYSEVDFSRYIRPVDDRNPMHRLWTDGHWLKAYLAYGCYWHSCSFCDTTLDYIRCFAPADPAALFSHLVLQAEKTGARGVHFVDEAAPLPSLMAFAGRNRSAGLPLVFWGNIRFGGIGTDEAAWLASGGMIGVSAGIEVASENGLKRLCKGFTMEQLAASCAALKEAGILVHGYLIYGYWDQSPQEMADSAETVRQFFEQGLLDSAYWHKFILTRHSRLYAEWEKGMHPALSVPDGAPDTGGGKRFALNDLVFTGEDSYIPYGGGLDRLLGFWMAGDTDAPVSEAFPSVEPKVPPDYITKLLDRYARKRDKDRNPPRFYAEPESYTGRLFFLGSKPFFRQDRKKPNLVWYWRLTEHKLPVRDRAAAEAIQALLETAAEPGRRQAEFYRDLEKAAGPDAGGVWKRLRSGGLVVLSPDTK